MKNKLLLSLLAIILISCSLNNIHSSVYNLNYKKYQINDAREFAIKDMEKGNFFYILGTKNGQYLTRGQRDTLMLRYGLRIENINDSKNQVFLFLSQYSNTVIDSLSKLKNIPKENIERDIYIYFIANLDKGSL